MKKLLLKKPLQLWKKCLNSSEDLIIMQTQEIKHLKEIMEPLSNKFVINIPGEIRFTNSLANLKYIKLKS